VKTPQRQPCSDLHHAVLPLPVAVTQALGRHCLAHSSSLALPAAWCVQGWISHIMLLWSKLYHLMLIGATLAWPAFHCTFCFAFRHNPVLFHKYPFILKHH
jgi:hypothetical protein